MKLLTHHPVRAARFGLCLVFLCLCAGCGRDNVKVYHVDASDATLAVSPPATAPSTPSSMPPGLPMPDNSGLPSLKYVLPAGWQEKQPSGMRVASFGVSQDGKQADVSVIPLGGMAGGDAANINRWRGQLGLANLGEDEILKLAEKIEVGGLPADLYDLAGTPPGAAGEQRILGTILHREDTVWFFKMTGDSGLVETQKAAFVALLKSLQFGAPAAAPAAVSAMDPGQLPPSHPSIPGLSLPGQMAPSDSSGKPVWTVPAGWQEGALSQFLIAKFVIAGAAGAQAAVNVSSLAGDGGGLLPNVNRWRSQLGLAPVGDAEIATLPTIDASGVAATIIDLAGTDSRTGKPARLIGAVLPAGGQTWFYKLMGDADLVAQQQDAFTKFVQSAKYPDVH